MAIGNFERVIDAGRLSVVRVIPSEKPVCAACRGQRQARCGVGLDMSRMPVIRPAGSIQRCHARLSLHMPGICCR